MTRTSFRRALVPGIAVLAIALTGCGAGNESDTLGQRWRQWQPLRRARWRWLQRPAGGAGGLGVGFQTANADVTVNYDPVGSGGGRESFISVPSRSPGPTRTCPTRRVS